MSSSDASYMTGIESRKIFCTMAFAEFANHDRFNVWDSHSHFLLLLWFNATGGKQQVVVAQYNHFLCETGTGNVLLVASYTCMDVNRETYVQIQICDDVEPADGIYVLNATCWDLWYSFYCSSTASAQRSSTTCKIMSPTVNPGFNTNQALTNDTLWENGPAASKYSNHNILLNDYKISYRLFLSSPFPDASRTE